MQILEHVFNYRDAAAGSFSRSFVEESVGLAMRGFFEAAKNPEHPIGKYPIDFDLYYLGLYDRATGKHHLRHLALHLGNAKTGPCVDPNSDEFVADLSCTPSVALSAIRDGIKENVG